MGNAHNSHRPTPSIVKKRYLFSVKESNTVLFVGVCANNQLWYIQEYKGTTDYYTKLLFLEAVGDKEVIIGAGDNSEILIGVLVTLIRVNDTCWYYHRKGVMF